MYAVLVLHIHVHVHVHVYVDFIHLAVLFYYFCEVSKQDVILSQEIKCFILLFSHHELIHELGTITSYKLSSQLNDVSNEWRERGGGGRINETHYM